MKDLNDEKIRSIDKSNMKHLLLTFPQQLEQAWQIGEKADFSLPATKFKNIIVAGMGGSAIGGQLLQSYLAEEISLPILVNRYYFVPQFVDQDTLCFVSSYSGNTEEALQAYEDAKAKRATIVCVTSGGQLRQKADKDNIPVVTIPLGYPPRTALGYLMIPILIILSRLNLIPDKSKNLQETIQLLKTRAQDYGSIETGKKNLALGIARKLIAKIPLIYASIWGFEAVALRWKGQFSENSKVLAFCNTFPELNHNEIVGWEVLKDLQQKIQVLYLRDQKDYYKIQKRMEVTRDILKEETSPVIEIFSEGQSLLARMFSLIFLGDFVSFYLAILNNVDPTSVKKIDYLKQRLNNFIIH